MSKRDQESPILKEIVPQIKGISRQQSMTAMSNLNNQISQNENDRLRDMPQKIVVIDGMIKERREHEALLKQQHI